MANEIDINNLRELHAATTQGEWSEKTRNTSSVENVYCDEEIVACCCYGGRNTSEANAKFVAAAHSAMPALLDELERLRSFEHAMHCGEKSIVGLQAENKKLRDALQELLDFSDTLQGRHYARSMHARIYAGTLLNQEASSKN